MLASDSLARRLHADELQSVLQCSRDARLATSLFCRLEAPDSPGHADDSEAQDLIDSEVLAWELAIQFQLEDIAAADECSAAQAAAVAWAAALVPADQARAQEAEDSRALAEYIIRQEAHDANFARRLASVGDDEWNSAGEEFCDPLPAPPKPASTPSSVPPPSCNPTAPSGHTPPRPVTATPSLNIKKTSRPQASGCRMHCGICMSDKRQSDMVCAGGDSDSSPDTPGTSAAAAGCGHYFCLECMESYVKGRVQDRNFPPRCAAPGCQAVLSHRDVSLLLSMSPEVYQVYCKLEVEASISERDKVYCPYKNCSSLLVRPQEDPGSAASGPTDCPHCHRAFCMRCRIPGWHKGLTCDQFQALPAHLKSADDVALLHLGSQKLWKQCPGCKQMVERAEGCNHIKCRCGCLFCYSCGAKYKSDKATATNVHGEQACACLLFDAPDDVAEGVPRAGRDLLLPILEVMGAVPFLDMRGGHAAPPGLRPPLQRPYRGGRKVSLKRCRHSASVYDCPQGPERCWFWHDEDDQAAL